MIFIRINFNHLRTIVLLPTVGVLLITFCDMFISLPSVLQCFSIFENVHVLLNLELQPTTIPSFSFVHGIRAICSIIIVIAHSGGFVLMHYTMIVSFLARHPNDMIAISRLMFTQPFHNGALIVFIFFMLAGMFTFYTSAGDQNRSLKMVIVFRILRFYPLIIATNALTVSLELFGDGPLFHHDILWPVIGGCYDRLHWILSFVSNFDDITKKVITNNSFRKTRLIGLNIF